MNNQFEANQNVKSFRDGASEASKRRIKNLPFFLSADPDSVGGDTLTCGVCKKEFALADIVKFIQHKVLTCNKENFNKDPDCKKASAENGDVTEVTSANQESANTTTTTTTMTSSEVSQSTTSTLTRRHSISTPTLPEVKALVGENNNSPLVASAASVKTELDSAFLSRKRKVECVDAESNTISTGKDNFLFNNL